MAKEFKCPWCKSIIEKNVDVCRYCTRDIVWKRPSFLVLIIICLILAPFTAGLSIPLAPLAWFLGATPQKR